MAQAQVQVAPKGQKGQPAARRYQAFYDQHGRKWGANIEIKTGDPTANIDRLGWDAPLVPAQKYLEVAKDTDGMTIPGRLVINYDGWIRDVDQQQADHLERLGFFAQALYGEKAGDVLTKPTPELRRLLKSEPAPIEPIYAAMRGDPWILGMEEGPAPKYLAPYFGTPAGLGGATEVDIDPAFVAELEARLLAAQKKGDVLLSPDVRAAIDEIKAQKKGAA